MTIAKDFAGKAAVAFVAVAMFLSMIAPAAQAQSSEDLQKMINDLLAQIASLQGQVGQGGNSVASGICPYTWTRDLNVGATGGDVMKLQQFLNADADTRVAATGAGSVGAETQNYGPATAAAVSKFQVKYRSEILSPAGLVNPTGYFGPSTRAKANASCVAAPVVVVPTPTPGTDDDSDDDMDSDLSGEADLTKVEISSADDDTVEEGAEDAPIAELTVEFEDGDASISRVDISISSTTVDSWDVLENVTLWVDGEMVAEKSASDEDDYLDEDDGSLRFSGLDLVGMEDEEVEIIIAATFQNNVDDTDLGEFEVTVDAIRFFDADGVATTDDGTGDMGDAVEFTLEEAGTDDEIIVKSSTSDPDSTTLQVEDDEKSDWYTVFAFDLDTDDSVSDIEVDSAVVTVALSAAYNVVIDDAELVIDGVTIDDFTVGSTTATTTTLTFDVDGDVTIDAGERAKAELRLRFKSLVTEGTTVQASVLSGAVDGEGADNVDSEGSATGDTHTLRSQGIAVEIDSDSAVVTTGDNAGDDYATFKLVLDVTAFEQDVFISTNQATSVVSSIVNGSGATVGGTSTVVITSSADVEGGSFKINEGETETVTITVTFDATTAGSAARLQLTSLAFDETDDSTPDQTWTALPVADYRTDIVTLVN